MGNLLTQCIVCGYLANGHAPPRPCPGQPQHTFEPLSKESLAKSLGATGGRPPIYATDEERNAARKATFRRSNDKRRGKVPRDESAS